MKIYGWHIVIDADEPTIASSLDKTIYCKKDDFLSRDNYSVSLVYQNNQERQISLLTNHKFTTPFPDQSWIFYVENVISFSWKTKGSVIHYCFHELATDEIFKFWLYHVVLPIYFSIAQTYRFLHAGAVEIEQKPVLFMAPSFGGKSTLTDYFIRRGHTLVTDDKMATFEKDGTYYAVPSHPYHRPFRTVEVLGNLCENSATNTKPIHAIYILKKSETDAKCEVRQLKGIEKFSRLHEGGEMNFSFFTPQYVSYLAALANHVSVFAITVPHDFDRLPEVYDILTKHSNSIKGQL